ncbi:hypothetical protein [Actinoplanes sp. CA-252034]|uniref:hypothetical protein n=1 Tax=Actinoplanes sp. CA-252034 TaxID=3239906 RepID=UPI003D950B34
MVAVEILMAADGATDADWIEAWATVVAALGTVGALVWQAWALSRERRTRREEIARLEEDRRESESRQARTILLHDARVESHNGMVSGFSAMIGNYGDSPVSHVFVNLEFDASGNEPTAKRVAEIGTKSVFCQKFSVMPSGFVESIFVDLSRHEIPWPTEEGNVMAAQSVFKPTISFVDMSGVQWKIEDGVPTRHARLHSAHLGYLIFRQEL